MFQSMDQGSQLTKYWDDARQGSAPCLVWTTDFQMVLAADQCRDIRYQRD